MCVCNIHILFFPSFWTWRFRQWCGLLWFPNGSEIKRKFIERMLREWNGGIEWESFWIMLQPLKPPGLRRLRKPSQDLTSEKFCAATCVPIVSSRSSGISTSMPGCDPLTTRNAETSAERVKAWQRGSWLKTLKASPKPRGIKTVKHSVWSCYQSFYQFNQRNNQDAFGRSFNNPCASKLPGHFLWTQEVCKDRF